MKSDHIDHHLSFAWVRKIPYTVCLILLTSSCIGILQSDSEVLSGYNLVGWDQSIPPSNSHLCGSLESFAGYLGIVAIWHWTNHNHESCISQLGEVTADLFTHSLCQLCCWLIVASPSLVSHLQNLTSNQFGITNIVRIQPGLNCVQKISNCHLPIQGSISKLFQTVLSSNNAQILLLQKLSHSYFLPLVEGAIVRLPYPCGKWLQGEFQLVQADWGNAFGTAKVWWIIAFIICIVFVTGHLW